MRGYQQAHRVHDLKDKDMGRYEVTSKHIGTYGYEDAVMQARAHKPEVTKMQGCEDTSKYT